MGSMSASDAAPLPRLGEVFFDVRGNSRSMRLSWYANTGIAVFSIWQGGTCTGTFRLPMDDLSRMVDSLRRGMNGGPGDDNAAGPAALGGQRPRLAIGAAAGRAVHRGDERADRRADRGLHFREGPGGCRCPANAGHYSAGQYGGQYGAGQRGGARPADGQRAAGGPRSTGGLRTTGGFPVTGDHMVPSAPPRLDITHEDVPKRQQAAAQQGKNRDYGSDAGQGSAVYGAPGYQDQAYQPPSPPQPQSPRVESPRVEPPRGQSQQGQYDRAQYEQAQYGSAQYQPPGNGAYQGGAYEHGAYENGAYESGRTARRRDTRHPATARRGIRSRPTTSRPRTNTATTSRVTRCPGGREHGAVALDFPAVSGGDNPGYQVIGLDPGPLPGYFQESGQVRQGEQQGVGEARNTRPRPTPRSSRCSRPPVTADAATGPQTFGSAAHEADRYSSPVGQPSYQPSYQPSGYQAAPADQDRTKNQSVSGGVPAGADQGYGQDGLGQAAPGRATGAVQVPAPPSGRPCGHWGLYRRWCGWHWDVSRGSARRQRLRA